jgi:hypothetical protein
VEAIVMLCQIATLLVWALCVLIVPSVASPQTGSGSSSRAFVFNGQKFYSVSQVKNPKWTRHQISTTAVYAAPFLKSRMPMPANLSTAYQDLESSNGGSEESRGLLQSRINGQTVDGSDGE